MALTWPFKDPNEVLDYHVDWAARLTGADTIASSSWLFGADDDEELVLDDNSYTDTTTTAWLSGGTLGDAYELTNRVVTAGGRTMDQTVKLKIKAK